MSNKNAAIVYRSDNYDTSQKMLMGRHVAGESFLKAFVQYGDVKEIFCATDTHDSYQAFKNRIESLTGTEPETRFIPYDRVEGLSAVGTVYIPSPGISTYAWLRRRLKPAGFSLCGITHTTASPGAMDQIAQLLLSPTEEWDAIICTSTAVRMMVKRLLDEWSDYLAERCRSKPIANIQLPVIPLGIDYARFSDPRIAERSRAAYRKQLGLSEDDVVFLYMGRLSYHAKAHPSAMYRGLQQAAERTKKKILLIQAGWFGNEATRKEFTDTAKTLCPDVKHLFVDGREPNVRSSIWYAADIFTSLPDNIQETFGLTPIEAMAAGLPSVVSDWNGYKDTVRNGIDGFLIPTRTPGPGCGEDLATALAMSRISYDHYIAYTSQCTSVDIDAAAEAYFNLIENPELRTRLGRNAQARAQETFDWRVIIKQYQALWTELTQRRRAWLAANPPPQPAEYPLRMDPFTLFSHYPTAAITPSQRVAIRDRRALEQLDYFLKTASTNIALPVLLPKEQLANLLKHLAANNQPQSVDSIRARFTEQEPAVVIRSLGWLCKLGLISIAEDE
jgi:glycosyltransferase involved in cell wall biosynthesis